MDHPFRDNVANDYERPNLRWECGQKDCGFQCVLGPDHRGQCQTEALCEPLFENGQWKCGRTKIQGGKCLAGPGTDGTCGCLIENCVPVRSLRSHRGRFVFACFAITLAIIGLTMSSPWRDRVLAPGPLTRSHAQMLASPSANKCASCHAAGQLGFGDWLLASVSDGANPRSEQVALCVDCHKQTMEPQFATNPHTYDPDKLQQLTLAAVAKPDRPSGSRTTRRKWFARVAIESIMARNTI